MLINHSSNYIEIVKSYQSSLSFNRHWNKATDTPASRKYTQSVL